jgi:hypothetical protein
MNPELSRLHAILNSEGVVPSIAYRRNKVIYELVCYVNCLIGCALSNRIDAMPVFIQRCREFMDSNPLEEHDNYYSVVRNYLTEIQRTFKLEKIKENA